MMTNRVICHILLQEIDDVLGHLFALVGYGGRETTQAHAMDFRCSMTQDKLKYSGQPFDQHSSALTILPQLHPKTTKYGLSYNLNSLNTRLQTGSDTYIPEFPIENNV